MVQGRDDGAREMKILRALIFTFLVIIPVLPMSAITVSAEPSPPMIDPALIPAWNALTELQEELSPGITLGDSFRFIQESTGIPITTAPMPPQQRGGFEFGDGKEPKITLNSSVLNEDPKVVATILSHELWHVSQILIQKSTSADCVRLEFEAFKISSAVWIVFFPDGELPVGTALERELTGIANIGMTQGDPRIYKMVVDNRGYQEQCQLYVPNSTSATAAPISPPVSSPPQTVNTNLAPRCYQISIDFLRRLRRETTLQSNDVEGSVDYLSNLCRENYADSFGASGVDCFESSLGLIPDALRGKITSNQSRNRELLREAMKAAMNVADKCKAGG